MIFFSSKLFSQSQELELQETETEDSYEEMEIYYQENSFQKIEINAFTHPDHAMLELADSSVWNRIKKHRNQTGWYFSAYEIQSIPGLDTAVVKKLIPYLSTEVVPGKWKDKTRNADIHYLSLRTVTDNLNSVSGKYRRGLKDFHNLNLSFRQLGRGHYIIRGNAWIQPSQKFRILIGHYKTDWAQGLLTGTYAPGKNAEPVRSVMRIPQQDIPWNSSGMHSRGIAFRYSLNRRLKFFFMLSSKKDPAVVRDSILQYWLWQAGTNAIMVREDQLSAGITSRHSKGESGILLQYSRTDVAQKVWQNHSSAPAFSLNHHRTIREKNLSGEIAVVNFRPAATASLVYPLSSKLEGASNLRSISEGYFSRYMNSFGLTYNSPALIGWYQSFRYYINRKITVSLSYDKTQRAPEKEKWSYSREELAGLLQLRFSKSHSVIAKLRKRITTDEEVSMQQYNWQIQQTIDALPFRIKARMQGAFSDMGQSLAAGGEVEYKRSRISFLAGVSFFRIDHYTLKENWYERPVFLSSGFSWIYNNELHRYLLIVYKPAKSLTLWLRGFLEEKEDQIPATGITIQVQYNFIKE